MDFLELAQKRVSTREFSDKRIEKEDLEVDFEKPWENPLEEKHVGYQLKMLDRMFCKQMLKY